VLISEAIGYGCTGIGTAILGNDLAATPIVLCGSDEIKKKFLTRLIEEPVMAVSFLKCPNILSTTTKKIYK
jgi:acyl-CoA dehydrogenase